MKAITVRGFTKRNRNKEMWNYRAGKSDKKSASSENHSSPQQQRQNQDNPIGANGSEPIEKEMGQTKEHAKKDVIGGVAEQQLMRGVIQSEKKKQIDGNKQAGKLAMQQSLGKWAHKREMELQKRGKKYK